MLRPHLHDISYYFILHDDAYSFPFSYYDSHTDIIDKSQLMPCTHCSEGGQKQPNCSSYFAEPARGKSVVISEIVPSPF